MLAAAVLLVVWEMLRQNLPDPMKEHWPWRLQLLDLGSGATVATVIAALVLTRMQYAQTVRPAIGFHQVLTKGKTEELSVGVIDEATWKVEVYNGSSGILTVESLSYRVASTDVVDGAEIPWLDHGGAGQVMRAAGLVEWEDFRLHKVGSGVPMFINDGSKDLILLTIKTSAMLRLAVLDMRFVVKDALGDLHEVLYPCRALFPVQRALPDTDEET
jgi:hypothetical protein